MKKLVLIVDDNNLDRQILKRELEGIYNIHEAGNGKEMFDYLSEKYMYVSAISLDICMPEMDGFEALRRIRSNQEYASIPVLLITSDTSIDTKKKALEFGANGILNKPYDPYLLQKALENMITMRENSILVNTLSKDRLTGMISHELFFDECDRMIRSHPAGYYIMSCIDIDNFKVINDQYGMDVGDEVLKHVADCIGICYRDLEGLACRFSADKFAVLYPEKYANTDIILNNHKEATAPKCLTHEIKIRIGRYHVQDSSIGANIMFERANVAEESIKGRYDVYIAQYNDSMRKNLLHEQQIVNAMNSALTNGEFIPFFQPQYNHATKAMIGAEALVRWKQGDIMVTPGEFVPIFEKNGFIYDVDKSIWKQVCALLKKWMEEGKNPLPVSVNISRLDLYKDDFFDTLCGLVEDYGIPTDLLRLEVTESAFSDSPQQIIMMVKKLIEYGFTVEIDDFGSGYSSLNTLKDVPASILKLDMKFFSETENSERSGNIIESVVRMAKWLGMAVIAEGVELEEQADYLKSIGCYYIQGYLYAKPMTVSEYEELLSGNAHEKKLTRLQTVTALDNNQFWNPQSIETLIFNSYVGGACILELHKGELELLRTNDQYLKEMQNVISDVADFSKLNPVNYLDEHFWKVLLSCVREAVSTKKEAKCELEINLTADATEYLQVTLRHIASTQERDMFYGVVVNLTELREAEQKERMSSDKLQTVLNQAGNGIAAIAKHNGTNEFVFVNDKYYEILGYTREEYHRMIHDNAFAVIHPDDRQKVMTRIRETNLTKQAETMEFRVIRADQTIVWIKASITLTSMFGYTDPVQVTVFTDVTEEKETNEQLLFLNTLSHDILTESDSECAFHKSLTRLLHYFDGDRAYIVELDFIRKTSSNTYEVCADGIGSEKEDLQNIPYQDSVFWLKEFRERRYIAIRETAQVEDRDTRDLLQKQGIESIIMAPIYEESLLIGFIGVDNPRCRMNQFNCLLPIGDYLAILLTKRNLNQTIVRDENAIRMLMDDTPGGFCKIEIHPDNSPVITYANQGFCFLMNKSYDEIVDLYGTGAYLYLHPEDVPIVAETAHKAFFDGGRFHVKCRLKSGRDEYVWIMMFGRFAFSKDKSIVLNAYFTEVEE